MASPTSSPASGTSEIGRIHLAGGPLAYARRVLDRRAAIGDAGFMPGVDLIRTARREADGAAIRMAGRLAVDRFRHHETPAIVRVSQPASGVLDAGLTAHRGKQGIIEFLRPRDVVASDHDMAEH